MGLRDLLYRCPACAAAIRAGQGDEAHCDRCGASYVRDPRGVIRADGAGPWQGTWPAAALVEAMHAHGLDEAVGADTRRSSRAPLATAEAELREVGACDPVRRGGRLVGWVERPADAAAGRVELTRSDLAFIADTGAEHRWPLREIVALQVASRELQVTPCKSHPVMGLAISSESVFRWEHLLQSAIADARAPERIVEFQPRIVTDRDLAALQGGRRTARTSDPHRRPGRRSTGTSARGSLAHESLPVYGPGRWLLRQGLRALGPLRVSGLEHVPEQGGALLFANHLSLLDPIAVQVACRRRVRALTKSTEFRKPSMARLLTAVGAVPVRRFQPDPQAVRMVLRLLERGEIVAIYPEGERSWDGALQPFRRGTLRLAAAAGVPVIPVGVEGSYERWPRWSSRPRRGPIHVRFGEPLHFDIASDRRAREEAVPTLDTQLRAALIRLGARGPSRSRPTSTSDDATAGGPADSDSVSSDLDPPSS